jgi:hypothetical protein
MELVSSVWARVGNMVGRLCRDQHKIAAFDLLFTRFRSRIDGRAEGSFPAIPLAALHNELGGHAIVANCE